MLLLREDKGREVAKDSPGPEEVRDPPRNIERTSLRWSSVVDLSPTRRVSSRLSAVAFFHVILFDREF